MRVFISAEITCNGLPLAVSGVATLMSKTHNIMKAYKFPDKLKKVSSKSVSWFGNGT